MRWRPGERSADIEDRRGQGGGPRVGLRVGLGGVVLLIALTALTGQNFLALLDPSVTQVDLGGGDAPQVPYQPTPEEERLVDFVSFVLDDVQGTWARALPKAGRPYRNAKLVLFTDSVRSGCGFAEAARGPFYCPLDQKVYVDLGFYNELRTRFGAPGDFAQAYVLAHEVGHHVQNLVGIAEQVQQAQQARPDQANALSVRMELQADCLAGVWAHSTAQRDILERGDVEEGLGAAAAVGDDRIQRGATGRVNPESWTHGSAAQRAAWFRRGLESGDMAACDTFRARLPADG